MSRTDKNVLCLFSQRILDRVDDELGLTRQLSTPSHFLVGFDRAFKSLAVAMDPWDCMLVFFRVSRKRTKASSFIGFVGLHRGRSG